MAKEYVMPKREAAIKGILTLCGRFLLEQGAMSNGFDFDFKAEMEMNGYHPDDSMLRISHWSTSKSLDLTGKEKNRLRFAFEKKVSPAIRKLMKSGDLTCLEIEGLPYEGEDSDCKELVGTVRETHRIGLYDAMFDEKGKQVVHQKDVDTTDDGCECGDPECPADEDE